MLAVIIHAYRLHVIQMTQGRIVGHIKVGAVLNRVHARVCCVVFTLDHWDAAVQFPDSSPTAESQDRSTRLDETDRATWNDLAVCL
jgi:hypothetical protein